MPGYASSLERSAWGPALEVLPRRSPTGQAERADAQLGPSVHLLFTDWPEAAGAGGPVLLGAALLDDAGKPVSVLMLGGRTAASQRS